MILKFNCSNKRFNELYVEKNSNEFDEKIFDIFDCIVVSDNLEINEKNYLEYNTLDYFYISISDLEKILRDIQKKNFLLTDEILVDLLDHCNNIYNLDNLVKKIEQSV